MTRNKLENLLHLVGWFCWKYHDARTCNTSIKFHEHLHIGNQAAPCWQTDRHTHDESKVAFHISFAYSAKDCRVNHRMCLCPCSQKTAGDETVRSLFTLFCCFYATFVFTAQAWMACVVIMLTSRWNESAAVHSLRVKVLHLTVAEYASCWYWVSQFLCNEEIYLRMQIL